MDIIYVVFAGPYSCRALVAYISATMMITYHNSCFSCIEKSRRNPQPPSTEDQNVGVVLCPPPVLKCSLRQCKNTDAAAPQFSSGFKDCGKTIHRPCYMTFIAKNNLSVLPDDKFCCGVKAHHSSVLKAAANPVNEKTRWDADGPNGPDTELNSTSISLGWWSTEGIYSKYRGGKDQTGKMKETYWQMLSQLIKDKGILVE
jgi:hypothetical protein